MARWILKVFLDVGRELINNDMRLVCGVMSPGVTHKHPMTRLSGRTVTLFLPVSDGGIVHHQTWAQDVVPIWQNIMS